MLNAYDLEAKDPEFAEAVLACIASILRYNKAVIPFLKANIVPLIIKQITQNVNNKFIARHSLKILRLCLMDEKTVELVLEQYQSLSILLL